MQATLGRNLRAWVLGCDCGRRRKQAASFEALLGPARWATLPQAIRRRFDAASGVDATTVYTGQIVDVHTSRIGWLLAQLARLIGGPLPTSRDVAVPATVVVTPARNGQIWTRLYSRHAGFPQAIHSIKRFAGPTGLEEYLGYGFGIALRLRTDERALHFDSDHYFLEVAGLRLPIPAWLAPGDLTISHEDMSHGRFAFRLRLAHPRLGCLMSQTVIFTDHG